MRPRDDGEIVIHWKRSTASVAIDAIKCRVPSERAIPVASPTCRILPCATCSALDHILICCDIQQAAAFLAEQQRSDLVCQGGIKFDESVHIKHALA